MNDDIKTEGINDEDTEQRENASAEATQQAEEAPADKTQQANEQTQNAYYQPPIYTEPTPNYYYPNTVEEPKRVRRVGTFTMGLALIATGVTAVVGLINPNFNFIFFAKFSPIILIFLGIEILIGSFAGKNVKLKYDFLSGFVCFMLICASIGIIVLVPLAKQYGFREYDSNRLSAELDNVYSTSLSNMPIASLRTEVYINGYEEDTTKLTIDTLRHQDFVRVSIQVLGDFTSKTAFAVQCKPILDKITPLGAQNKEIYLHSTPNSEKGTIYSIRISDSFVAGISVENLTLMVDDNRISDEHSQLQRKEEELQSRQEQAEQQLSSRAEELEEQYQSREIEMQSRQEQLDEQHQSRAEELEQKYQSKQEQLQSKMS